MNLRKSGVNTCRDYNLGPDLIYLMGEHLLRNKTFRFIFRHFKLLIVPSNYLQVLSVKAYD